MPTPDGRRHHHRDDPRIEAAPKLACCKPCRACGRPFALWPRHAVCCGFHSPIFARGLAATQGPHRPVLGSTTPLSAPRLGGSCGLPELPGRAPFGGHIMSQTTSRPPCWPALAGCALDDDLEGSYEEGPENIIDHAKRIGAGVRQPATRQTALRPRPEPWTRFVFVQGIFAYTPR